MLLRKAKGQGKKDSSQPSGLRRWPRLWHSSLALAPATQNLAAQRGQEVRVVRKFESISAEIEKKEKGDEFLIKDPVTSEAAKANSQRAGRRTRKFGDGTRLARVVLGGSDLRNFHG